MITSTIIDFFREGVPLATAITGGVLMSKRGSGVKGYVFTGLGALGGYVAGRLVVSAAMKAIEMTTAAPPLPTKTETISGVPEAPGIDEPGPLRVVR